MAVHRDKMLQNLEFFKDVNRMKSAFGIIPNSKQIESVNRQINRYRSLSDEELRRMDSKYENQWPYELTLSQRYDRMFHEADVRLNVVQTILWQNLKIDFTKTDDPIRKNLGAILSSLKDLEGFLKVNLYIGNFQENANLIDNKDPETLLRLFNSSYKKYNTTS